MSDIEVVVTESLVSVFVPSDLDSFATVTPTPNAVPKSLGTGKIANGWIDTGAGTGFVDIPSVQTITGAKTFSAALSVTASLVTVGDGTTATDKNIFIDGPAGFNKVLALRSGGLNRWTFYSDAVAEAGADAGSNLRLAASNDAGVSIDFPISIVRAAGGALTISRKTNLGTIGATFPGNIIAGVQDGTAAIAGQVGERIRSQLTGVAVGATGVTANLTSITPTRGDWLMGATVVISGGATGLTAGSTLFVSLVSVSAGTGISGYTLVQQTIPTLVANGLYSVALPLVDTGSIAASTTFYVTAYMTYAAGTPTADVSVIATRIR